MYVEIQIWLEISMEWQTIAIAHDAKTLLALLEFCKLKKYYVVAELSLKNGSRTVATVDGNRHCIDVLDTVETIANELNLKWEY